MIIESINESKAYARRIRKQFLASFLLLVVFFFLGYFFAQSYPKETAEYLEKVREFFESMSELTQWDMFVSIFDNNMHAMLLIIVMGAFAGFFSVTFLFTNGFMLGVFAYSYVSQGMWPVFIAGITPHGIIEIPCMILSAASGMRIGTAAVKKLFLQPADVTQEMADGLKFAAGAIIPLLLIAAFIEAYVTPFFIYFIQYAAWK